MYFHEFINIFHYLIKKLKNIFVEDLPGNINFTEGWRYLDLASNIMEKEVCAGVSE